MGEKKKIYLSLDDLNKLYGISPAILNIIKNKSKRRRKKRTRKIDNGTMGNKPSPSDHMVGSSSALAVATQQLNQSNINKRIEDINRNNLMIENKNKNNLMIEDKKDNPSQEDIQLKNIQKIYNKLKNKETLTDDELNKYEEIHSVMFPTQTNKAKRKSNITRRKTFIVPEPMMTNPLASTQSNVMGRTESYTNIRISDDDSAGTNTVGTSSDNFINQNVEEFLPTETNTEPVVEDPNSFFMDEEVNMDLPIDESNLDVLPPIEEDSKDDITDEYRSYDSFKGTEGRDELRKIAGKNGISYQGINKKPLYDLLLENNLIPKK